MTASDSTRSDRNPCRRRSRKPFGTALAVARLVSQRAAQVYIDNGHRPDGVAVIEIQRHEPGRALTLRWVLYARACG